MEEYDCPKSASVGMVWGAFDIFFSQHGNGSQGCAVGVVGERRLGRQVLVMMTQV